MGQQVERGITAANGSYIGFLEYKPADYATSTGTKYPLIIFFHGIGERGNGTTDLYKVKKNGIPKYIDRGHKMRFFWNGKWETFLVLTPQLDSKYGNWQNFYGEEMINYAKKNLRIDTNRIIMAGLSLGGGGVWSYASASVTNSQKLAAAAPSCGVCTMNNGCSLANANLPVWAEHAMDDPTVSVTCTINAVNKINACYPKIAPIKIIYPTGGHVIWDRMFDTAYTWHDVNIYEWFLAQNKSLAPNKLPVAKASGTTSISTATAATTLYGTSSTDADGKIVRYKWKQLNGPGTASISAVFGSSTLVSGLSTAGTYNFELTVVDNRASWTKDTIAVTVSTQVVQNKLPVANAGADVSITLPENGVNFDGSASYDPDGSISAYQWTVLDGPSTPAISGASLAKASVSGLLQGTYHFILTVTDNSGGKDSDTLAVTVNKAIVVNLSPVAQAGPDQSISLPTNSVSLDASGSADPDGTIASYKWSFLDGPSNPSLSGQNTSSLSAGGLLEGTYSFVLEVTDNAGAAAQDTVQVVVLPDPNKKPVADAGSNILIYLPQNSVSLQGSNSFDPDGSIQKYRWAQISGPSQAVFGSANSAATTLGSLLEGIYEISLTVTDNQGATGSDTLVISVKKAANQVPRVITNGDQSIKLPVDSVYLQGSGSFDPDGTIQTYSWAYISGPGTYSLTNPEEANTQVHGLSEGIYRFELTITDNLGESAADTVSVTVLPKSNETPVAKAGINIEIQVPASTATLDGSLSYDPDGGALTFQWNKLKGPDGDLVDSPDSVKTAVSGLTEGVYWYELWVSDDQGAISTDTIRITVLSTNNMAPVANAGTYINISLPENSVTLNGTGSEDPDGEITSFAWRLISGGQYAIADSSAAITRVSNLEMGTYLFELKVTDNLGLSSADTMRVRVYPKPIDPPVANAGKDFSVTLPIDSVLLVSTGSYDPDGMITMFEWNQVSGPDSVTINNRNEATANLTRLIAGKYAFELVVTDNDGAKAKDTVVVTVLNSGNTKPVAKAGADRTLTLPVSQTTLDGSASYDPDGKIVKYAWSKTSGTGTYKFNDSTLSKTALSSLQAGDYVFRLTVTDDGGLKASDDIKIRVLPAPNSAPIADAGADIILNAPDSVAQLDGSASSDADGTIATYSWKQLSGPGVSVIGAASSKISPVSGLVPGTYVFELQVTDNSGAADRDSMSIIIKKKVNVAPTANAGRDKSVPSKTDFLLDGTASYDPDGTIADYNWTKISGPGGLTLVNSSTATPKVIGAAEGQYVFQLTIRDNEGLEASDAVTILVKATANKKPRANAGADTTLAYPITESVLTGAASSDPDGTITAYSWTQLEGPAPAMIENNLEAQTKVKDLQVGVYAFELAVTDNAGAIARDTVNIRIVNNLRAIDNLMTYPNPAVSQVTVRIKSDSLGLTKLTVLDLYGRVILTRQTEKASTVYQQTIPLGTLNPGLYFIEVNIADKKKMVTRLIKQ